jgi:hypothetical protein
MDAVLGNRGALGSACRIHELVRLSLALSFWWRPPVKFRSKSPVFLELVPHPRWFWL